MKNQLLQQERNEQERKTKTEGHLLVKCADQPGIVSKLSTFLHKHEANIVESSQYSSDPEGGMFFIRLAYNFENILNKKQQMEEEFEKISAEYGMSYRFHYPSIRTRAAIFVSKDLNCLMELLWEWQNGDLPMDIPLIISNSEVARPIVEAHGIPFIYIPANKDIREQVEAQQILHQWPEYAQVYNLLRNRNFGILIS